MYANDVKLGPLTIYTTIAITNDTSDFRMNGHTQVRPQNRTHHQLADLGPPHLRTQSRSPKAQAVK
jgi:hypothetical protein